MYKFLFLLFLLPSLCFGQKEISPEKKHPIDLRTCQSNFRFTPLRSTNPNAVENFLLGSVSNLNDISGSIKLLSKIESKTGFHFLFQQCYGTIPVFRGQIKVNTDKAGNIRSVFDNSFAITERNVTGDFPSSDIITAYLKTIGSTTSIRKEKNYFLEGRTFVPVVRIEIVKITSEYFEVLLHESGKVLYRHDLNSYYQQPSNDSIVSASVFLPDPLTRAGKIYEGQYRDNNDSDKSEINDQRVNVNLSVSHINDTFYLKSPFAVLKEFSDPVTVPAFSKEVPYFHYPRSMSEFEDINAYYHINSFQNYLQSLGYTNLANYPIWIDAHALNGEENSMFSPGYVPPRLFFGEGGVDDAEDADVIIHEYMHAISHSAAPYTNSGTERQTLDEGIGDYFASSYSREINPFRWSEVFTWDGHNEFWKGRNTVSDKHYPEGLVYNIYKDAEIWSSVLMEIWGDIGKGPADDILLESVYNYAGGMTLADAAQLYLKTDSLLYNGLHHARICNRMYEKGLIPSCADYASPMVPETDFIQLLETGAFANNAHAVLKFKESTPAYIHLYDIQGKSIYSEEIPACKEYLIGGKTLVKGLYLLYVKTPKDTATFKLVKLSQAH